MEQRSASYKHIVTEGTHYEIGRALGACFKQDAQLIAFMTSPFMNAPEMQPAAAEHALEQFERYNPGINDEIRGFADEINVAAEKVVYYYAYLQPQGHCSQAAVHCETADGGHTYHMRTYDYGWEDEPYNQLLLTTTKVKGKPCQIGFALQLFGRYDGMNDEGLSVTTTSGRIRPELTGEGFVFPGVVRALLDHCSTVKEAVLLIRSMPVCDYRNFLIADRDGDIALVEAAGTEVQAEVYPAARNRSLQLAVSANHYTLPAMRKHNRNIMANSIDRYNALQAALATAPADGDILSVMKRLSGQPVPVGVRCAHYSEGLGTMWSMICDNTLREAHICFGSPGHNPWRSFGFGDPPGICTYTAILPDEPSEERFWS